MSDDWLSLTSALREIMRAHAPGWTDSHHSDPSITILELITYLAENLRLDETSSDGLSAAAARAIQALERVVDREAAVVVVDGERWERVDTLADAGPDAPVFTFDEWSGEITFGDGVHGRAPQPGAVVAARYRDPSNSAAATTWIAVRTTWPPRHRPFTVWLRQGAPAQLRTGMFSTERWSGTTRPNYFFGRVLGVEDFREEQTYHREKHRRHLQTLHGSGVARGLDVSISSDGTRMTVVPGIAVDASGHQIVLDEPVVITPPDTTSPAWLVVEYAETGIDFVPTANDDPQARRIQEGCRILLTPAPSDTGVTLARLLYEANAWRIDGTFAPARAR